MITDTFDPAKGVPGLGDWSIRFRPGTERILGPWVAPDYISGRRWKAGGYVQNWAHDTLVVTDGRLGPGADRAAVLAAALYSGKINRFEFGRKGEPWTVSGRHILSWAGSSDSVGPCINAAGQTAYAGSLATYLFSVLVSGNYTNGLSVDATAASVSGSALNCDISANDVFRERLNKLLGPNGGHEYWCSPAGTIYVAGRADTSDDVFQYSPKVIFGEDLAHEVSGALRSIPSTIQATFDVENERETDAWSNGNGSGTTTDGGSGRLNKSYDGTTAHVATKFIGASDELADQYTGVAVEAGGRQDVISITADVTSLRRYCKPGDWVWVHAPRIGLFDTANTVQHGGQTLAPIRYRIAELRYPITAQHGVYVIHNATAYTGTNAVQDVTDYIIPEDGSTTVVVSTAPPATLRNTVLGTQNQPGWETKR